MKPRAKRSTKTGKGSGQAHSKEATRDALIEAGGALFAKYGLDRPSLDDICAHAGFTRGAVYVHFKDRDDFLVAVMDRVGRRIVDELLVAGGGDGLTGAMQRFLEASATGKYPLMPAGGIRPHQLLDACARSRPVRERYLALVETSRARIKDLVAGGQKDGLVTRDLDPWNASTLLIALVVGLQTLADLGAPVPLADLAPDVLALLAPRA